MDVRSISLARVVRGIIKVDGDPGWIYDVAGVRTFH
jgi:hypothetical protein